MDSSEDREKKYRPYREGLTRQLNQAHCGQEARTDFYLNRQTRGAVGRLHPATGGGGQLEGFTGGPSQAQEVWQELQPSLAMVGRLEELVSWWRPVQP